MKTKEDLQEILRASDARVAAAFAAMRRSFEDALTREKERLALQLAAEVAAPTPAPMFGLPVAQAIVSSFVTRDERDRIVNRVELRTQFGSYYPLEIDDRGSGASQGPALKPNTRYVVVVAIYALPSEEPSQ